MLDVVGTQGVDVAWWIRGVSVWSCGRGVVDRRGVDMAVWTWPRGCDGYAGCQRGCVDVVVSTCWVSMWWGRGVKVLAWGRCGGCLGGRVLRMVMGLGPTSLSGGEGHRGHGDEGPHRGGGGGGGVEGRMNQHQQLMFN